MNWAEAKVEGRAPAARGGHAGVSLGDSCFYFGGADRTLKVYDEVVKCTYDAKDGRLTWEKVSLAVESSEGCKSRTGCSCTLLGGAMYIFAGQEPHSGALFNDVFKVDLATATLSRVDVKGRSPPPRHSHTSVPLNDKCMIVFGGAGREAPLNDTWIFDTEASTWTYPPVCGAIPRAREMHAASKVGEKVVVFGGRDAEGRVLQDVSVLDLVKMAWEKPKRTDHPRCAHALVNVRFPRTLVAGTITAEEDGGAEGQSGLLVMGGFSGNHVENSVLFMTQDFSSVLEVTDQVSGAPPTPCFAHVGLPIVDESGYTRALLSFGGINLSEDTNNLSLIRFD